MTDLRKDWMRLPGEDSNFGSAKKIRMGGLIDEEDTDVRARGYQGIVPAHQAVGSIENWHISVQDEEKRLRMRKFVPCEEMFVANLDGSPAMSPGEVLDSAYGLVANEFEFSEPDLKEEEDERGQELKAGPTMDLTSEIKEWIRERYGEILKEQEGIIPKPEKEISVIAIHPQIERPKISLMHLKMHEFWGLKHKKPPQKRMLSWRRARRQHQRFNRIEI